MNYSSAIYKWYATRHRPFDLTFLNGYLQFLKPLSYYFHNFNEVEVDDYYYEWVYAYELIVKIRYLFLWDKYLLCMYILDIL